MTISFLEERTLLTNNLNMIIDSINLESIDKWFLVRASSWLISWSCVSICLPVCLFQLAYWDVLLTSLVGSLGVPQDQLGAGSGDVKMKRTSKMKTTSKMKKTLKKLRQPQKCRRPQKWRRPQQWRQPWKGRQPQKLGRLHKWRNPQNWGQT